MDPNANPQAPTGPTPDQQVSQNGAADQTPAPQTPLPDWQQGLTTDSQQAPTPMGAQTMPPTPGVGPDSGVGMSTQPVAPQTPTMSPQPTSPVMGMASPSQKKKMPMMIIIIGLVVVIALAVGAYFLFGNNNKSANNAARQSERTASSSAIDLTTLSGATLNPPADLSGYKANSATTAGQYIYETSASTNTNVCQLQLGIYTPAQLPGTDLNDIVKKGLT